jgi:uncharacterized phage protein (TIGR01671 family)
MNDRDRFRFRAWNKEEKKYYYDAEKTYDYLINGIMSESFGVLLEDDRYIIEQCTGIKDCNGKLIYEGDLVRWVLEEEIKKYGVVKWCNVNGIVGGSWEAVDYRPDGNIADSGYYFGFFWEIYGNIHELEIE